MNVLRFTLLSGLIAMLVSACGGGGSSNCDTPLSVDYVNQELSSGDIFTRYNINVSDTAPIYEDGNQGGNYDIDQIMLSRVDSGGDQTIAVSYSVHATQAAPADSYIAFYIDTDGSSATGTLVGSGVYADVLILDAVGDSSPGNVGITNAYFEWDDAAGKWVAGTKYGTTSSTASYQAGCSLGLAVFVPWYTPLASFSVTKAKGIMMLRTFGTDDPNMPGAVIDSTTDFSFSFP